MAVWIVRWSRAYWLHWELIPSVLTPVTRDKYAASLVAGSNKARTVQATIGRSPQRLASRSAVCASRKFHETDKALYISPSSQRWSAACNGTATASSIESVLLSPTDPTCWADWALARPGRPACWRVREAEASEPNAFPSIPIRGRSWSWKTEARFEDLVKPGDYRTCPNASCTLVIGLA